MNIVQTVAFWLLTILAWVQVIGTAKLIVLDTKQLNQVRWIGIGVSALYFILAMIATLTMLGWF